MALQIDSISPSSITEYAGTVVPMSVTASGSSASAVYTVRHNMASTEVCSAIHRRGDNVYAGFGNTASVDTVILKSSDGGITFNPTPIYTMPSKYTYVSAICETSSGAILYGGYTTNNTVEIYKNGSVVWTSSTKTSARIYSIEEAVDGSLLAAVGTSTAQLLRSIDDGDTWTQIESYAQGTFTRIVRFNGADYTTLSASSGSDGVYRIVNGVATKVLTYNAYLQLTQISESKLMVIEYASPFSAKVTSDGTNWPNHTGTIPTVTDTGHDQSCYLDGVSYVADYSTGIIYYSDDEAVTWNSISAYAGIERCSALTPMNDRHTILFGGGTSTGDGDVIELSPAGTYYSYQLIDKSDDSTISTSNQYNYTSDVADNGKNFQWSVTDGVDTVLSSLIPVVVLAGSTYVKFLCGDAEINILPLYGYKTDIELSMERSVDSRGFVTWLDNTKNYDNYTTEFSFHTEDANGFELFNAFDSENDIYITSPYSNGFRPLGIGFATGQNYSVNVYDVESDGKVDIFNTARTYKCKITNAISNVYTGYTKSSTISDGIPLLQHWQIGTMYLPFADWSQIMNDDRKVLKTGGGSSYVVDTTKAYGDVSRIRVTCSEEQARLILQYFTETMRGTDRTATFPLGYSIFGDRYTGITSCTVRLYEPILSIVHRGLNTVEIEFSLQMVGV